VKKKVGQAQTKNKSSKWYPNNFFCII